jgi:RimJ/RimL family protein N-acetyltransferase
VTVLETERLVLRPFVADDFPAYAAMVADPDVVRYLGHPPMDRETAWRHMALVVGHSVLRGWTQQAVELRATGEVIGRCGLWQPEGWPGLEVGWVLARSAWGHGYATEAASAWRDWAFDVLGADELVSVVHIQNTASSRVAERIGHRRLRDIELRGHPCVLYGQQRPGA